MANDGDSHKIMFAENRRNKCASSFRRNHGLRGSASPVLTATGFVNGRGQYLTHRIHTHWPITKKFVASDYVGDPCGCAKFGANSSMGSFWANGWNITKFVIYTFFSDPSTDFHAWWLKRSGLAQGCAFWGFVNIAPYFGGEIFPKPHFWGRE